MSRYQIFSLIVLSIFSFLNGDEILFNYDEQEFIDRHEKVSVAMLDNFPPFSFIEDKYHQGYSVDLFKLIGEKTGLKFEFLLGDWSQNLKHFKNGDIEVIDCISHNKDREGYTLYTKPYHKTTTAIISRNNTINYEGERSLKGKKVGTLKDIFFIEKLKEIDEVDVVEFNSGEELIKELVYGNIDYLVYNYEVSERIIAKNGFSNLKVVGDFQYNGNSFLDLSIGVNRGSEVVYSIIKKGLSAITFEERVQLEKLWLDQSSSSYLDNNLTNSSRIIINPSKLIERPKIALIIPRNDLFWQTATAYGKAAANDLDIEFKQFNIKNSRKEMVRKVEEICKEGYDAIIFQEFEGVGTEILSITEKSGVHTFLINTDLVSEIVTPRTKYPHLIGKMTPNDRLAGYEMIRDLVDIVNSSDISDIHLFALGGDEDQEASIERVKGLDDYLKQHGNIKDVTKVFGNWSRELAGDLFEEAISEDSLINIVWSASDNMSYGVIDKVKELGIKRPIFSGAINWNQQSFTELDRGNLSSLYGGHFIEVAWALVLIHDYLNGRDFLNQGLSLKSTLKPVTQANFGAAINLKSINAEAYDFRYFSKIYNPNLFQYDFDIYRLFAQNSGDRYQISLDSRELEFLGKHPVINVLYKPDFSPFDFIVGNEPVGYSIDLANIIAKRLGVRFNYINVIDLQDSKYSIDIKATTLDVEDYKGFTLSDPYFKDRNHFIVRRESRGIETFSDLFGKRLALSRPMAYIDSIKNRYPQIEIVEAKDRLESFKLVAEGLADATIELSSIGNYYINHKLLNELKVSGWVSELTTNTNRSIHFAIRDDWSIFQNLINRVLLSITPSELAEIKGEWFNQGDLIRSDNRLGLLPYEIDYIERKGSIKMCVDPLWMPYEKIDENGNHIGIAADFIQLIEDKTGLTIELLPTESWSESLQKAENRECDILSFLNETPDRSKYLNFTQEIYSDQEVIVTRDDIPFLSGLPSLGGKSVGMIKGYKLDEYIQKYHQDINLVYVESHQEALKLVSEGDLYATILNLTTFSYEGSKSKYSNLKVVGEAGLKNIYKIGVRNDDLTLFTILNKAVLSFEEGDKHRIFNKWIVSDISYQDYTLIWRIVIGSIIVLTASLFWNRRLAKLNFKIEAANRAMAKSDQAKSDFLANMSHEIRTPMNAIIGFTELGQNSNDQKSSNIYFSRIEHSAKLLLGIINDILDFSKLDLDKLELESVNFRLRDNIEQITSMFQHQLKSKGIDIVIDIEDRVPEVVVGDPLRLGQILTNLISNGIKFTDSGEVTIMVTLLNVDDDNYQLYFEVEDSGIGMSEEQQRGLFSPFTQGDSSITRTHGGTGLGLSITKKLVELMGGKIGVDSEVGRGSRFYFDLTLMRGDLDKIVVDSKVKRGKERSFDHLSGAKILLAEDNLINQQIAKEILEKEGVDLTIVSNGKEVLESINNRPFQLILMDIQMPVMDGHTATKNLRSQGVDIPIVALTAHALNESRESSLKSGMDDFLTKPYSYLELLEIVDRWINKKNRELGSCDHPETEDRIDEDYLDIAGGISRVGDQKLYFKLLKQFYNQYEGKLNFLKESTSDEELKPFIHSFKGSSGTIGANRLYEEAQSFERSLTDNCSDLEKVRAELIETFEITFNKISKEIKGEVPMENIETNRELSKLDIVAKLSLLIGYLEDGNAKYFDIVKELNNLISKKNLLDKLAIIGDLLEECEFDQAIEIVEELILEVKSSYE